MDIKKIMPFFLLTLAAPLFFGSVGTEDQRKYAIEDVQALDSFIVNSGKAGDLCTHFEDAYRYYDIYLETPGYDLYKNRLSLRFRKRIFNTDLSTYSLQLKSEMDTGSSVRMEVEEAELEIYSVKTEDGWLALTSVLDLLFNQLENGAPDLQSENTQKAIRLLNGWFSLKTGTPVAPLQKLSHLNLPGLDGENLKKLSPVLCGSDIRKRSHIYIDINNAPKNLADLPMNRSDYASTPVFFREHFEFNWVMESSLDNAVFYPLFESKIKSVRISEYEVENKYPIRDKGSELMDLYEKWILGHFKSGKNTDSKYCYSIKSLRG